MTEKGYRKTSVYMKNKELSDQIRPLRRAIVREYGLEWPVAKYCQDGVRCRSIIAWIASRKFGMGYEFVTAICSMESVSSVGESIRKVDSTPELLARAESLYQKYKGAA